MISIHEEFILQAQRQFDALLALVEAAQGQRIDCVEGDVLAGLLGLGLTLIRQFVASKGTGDAGPSLDTASGTWKRLENLHPRRYVSIFGELTIDRTVYGTLNSAFLRVTFRTCCKGGCKSAASTRITRGRSRVWPPFSASSHRSAVSNR
jgi:hypothetical protein